MIKSICIENFKCFSEPTEIHFSKLSLFSGLNSSGKSSVYQLLLILKQSINSVVNDSYGNILPSLELNGELISLGTHDEILSNKNRKHFSITIVTNGGNTCTYRYSLPSNKDCIGYNFDKGKVFFLSEFTFSSMKSDFSFSIAVRDNKWFFSAKKAMNFCNGDMSYFAKNFFDDKFTPVYDNVKGDDVVISQNVENIRDEFSAIISIDGVRQVDLSGYNIKEIVCDPVHFKDLLDPLCAEFYDINEFSNFVYEKYGYQFKNFSLRCTYALPARIHSILISGIKYLPPFRGVPKRVYTFADDFPLPNYDNMKSQVIAYNYDFNEGSIKEDTLDAAIRYWLVDSLALAENIEINHREYISSELFLVINSKTIPINNVGFGTSQIIPIIYKILISPRNSIIIVDEPETHLHASLQSLLADFLLAMAMCGKIIIIETHSEYLIDKLIYFSVKYNYLSSAISLNWVKREGISSFVSKIQFDSLGFISNAPCGFLNEKSKLVAELNIIRMEKFASEK